MKYIKIYEDTEDPDLVGEEMNALFLEDMIKALHKDGFKTARVSPKDPKIVEARESEAPQAKVYVQEYLDIILSMTGADLNAEFNPKEKARYFSYLKGELKPEDKKLVIYSKLDRLKFLPVGLFYIAGGIFFTFPKVSEGNWWYLLIMFVPLLAFRFLAPTLNMLNLPFPLNPKDEAWMQNGKKITKALIWFFWVIAVPMIYLFLRTPEFQWDSLISGNKEMIRMTVNFMAPIIFVGATLYVFKLAFHQRVYLNPAEFSEKEIEDIRQKKEKVINELILK